MNSRFRHSLSMAGAIFFLLCLTGVSVSAQEAAAGSRDRTVVKQQTDGNPEAAASSASSSKEVATDNQKEPGLSASSASTTAPVSFLAPRPLPPPGKHLTPEPAASSAQAASSDEWHFMVAPYFWLISIDGTVGAGDITTDIDPSASDILDALNFGFLATFEARKNRFMVVTDLIYASFEESKDTSGPLFSALKANMKIFMLSPVVGYRLAESDAGSLDALVGIRFWHTSTRLELEPGLLAGRVRESSKNWTDVIAGLRGMAHLSKAFSLIGRGDVGGGGSDLTYQLFGGVGINLSESFSLFGGYRYLFIKYTRDDFLFDGAFKGPMLGAAFRF